MIRSAILGALITFGAASNAAGEDRTSYFCAADVSGGLFFNEQLKRWQATSFRADKSAASVSASSQRELVQTNLARTK